MSRWEARDEKRLLSLLVGDYYGERPEEKLDFIRGEKQKRAAWLCRKTGCGKESVVLEIGSGMGLTSKHVAREVKLLYCSDISSSFLEAARRECAGTPNIEFIKIEEQPAVFSFANEHFDLIFADAVFIHLNLYDIYWYFAEFQRLVRKRGTVFINVMNAAKMDTRKLSQMAGFYRDNRASLDHLLCWNSLPAVTAIASHFGFRLAAQFGNGWLRPRETVDLLFRKR